MLIYEVEGGEGDSKEKTKEIWVRGLGAWFFFNVDAVLIDNDIDRCMTEKSTYPWEYLGRRLALSQPRAP